MHVDAGTKTDVIEFKTHYNEFQYETMLGKENERLCETITIVPKKEPFETLTVTPPEIVNTPNMIQPPIIISADKYELPEI